MADEAALTDQMGRMADDAAFEAVGRTGGATGKAGAEDKAAAKAEALGDPDGS